MSLAGTPEHASSRRSGASAPLSVDDASSLQSLMANQKAAASATRSDRAAVASSHAQITRAATSTHARPLRSPILRLQQRRTSSTLSSTSLPLHFAAARRFSARGAALDSEVERQELEDEETAEWEGGEGKGWGSQVAQSGLTRRGAEPEMLRAVSRERHALQATWRTWRAARKLAPWTDASQAQQRKAASGPQKTAASPSQSSQAGHCFISKSPVGVDERLDPFAGESGVLYGGRDNSSEEMASRSWKCS
ncbi:hypothetical protein BHM03_00023149, partial [Ensete ventricosum]